MVQLGKGAAVCGLLTFGTITSLFAKLVYELKGEGLDGHEKYFRKPWAMTTIMFMGMSMCLPMAYWEDYTAARKRRQARAESSEALLGGNGTDDAPVRSELKDALMLAIPTVFDLIATVLMNVGLLTVTASVYQMMRGAEMLFAAILAVVFLRRRLNKFHYGGIACCVVGIVLVGLSSTLSGEGGVIPVSQAQILFGMALIVLSQAVQAAQITFEDYFMSEMSISAMKIVGYEGVIGTGIMLFVLAPIVRLLPGAEGNGVHEDIVDTVHMVASNPKLMVVLSTQMYALLAYNYTGMHVTGHLGAVFRTVLETMRTLFVWLVGLVLFYTGTGLGESWNRYSLIQAAGFVVLVTGTLVYGKGDEKEAQQVVQEYLEAQAAGDPEAAAAAADPLLEQLAAAAQPVPGHSASRAAPIMMSPSPMMASRSMAAGSYREALATSFRSAHFGSIPQ